MGNTFRTGKLMNGLYVDDSGNVGVGTTSPSSIISGAKVLQVNGSSYGFILPTAGTVIGQMIADAGAGVAIGSRSNDYVTITTNDVERIRVTTAGNVGIGIVPQSWSSSYKSLQVSNASLLNDIGANTYLGNNTYVGTDGQWKYSITAGASIMGLETNSWVFYNAASGSANANISWTERMRITSSGNVGIGTTTPEGPLHIRGAISAGYVGMAIVNYVSTTNTSAGIDFGVDASSVYNGGGNAQIKVTNTNGGDNRSKMDLNIWTGAALVTGINISDAGKVSFPAATAMNYAVSSATAVTVTNNCSPTTVASATITTSGKPVLITVSGDNNPLGGPSWCYVMIFRNGSAVGKRVIAESTANSANVPFALTHIDTPSAGSNTYTAMVSVCGSNSIIFGETGDVQAPTITVVELL